jgi:CheY-like chemotaxis protein
VRALSKPFGDLSCQRTPTHANARQRTPTPVNARQRPSTPVNARAVQGGPRASEAGLICREGLPEIVCGCSTSGRSPGRHRNLAGLNGGFFRKRNDEMPVCPSRVRREKACRAAGRLGRLLDVAIVLVVEDNADLREMYEEMLGLAGHEVLLAETAHDAFVALEALRPNVLLLDLGVEGGTQDLVAAIRTRPELARTAVVLASGARDLDKWAQSLGAEAYLQKPFTHEQLIEAVGRVAAA